METVQKTIVIRVAEDSSVTENRVSAANEYEKFFFGVITKIDCELTRKAESGGYEAVCRLEVVKKVDKKPKEGVYTPYIGCSRW